MTARHHYARSCFERGLFRNLDSFSELEDRISALPSEKERGDAFEVFAEAYLATQKIVQASAVWPGQSVPLDVLKEHKLPLRDLGADGVYRTIGGELNAYQVKFRGGRPSLRWEELGTFMGLTDQVDQRVLFTNVVDLPEVMNERSHFFCIRGSDLDRLTGQEFIAINEWFSTGLYRTQKKKPLPHQVEALSAIEAALDQEDRATAVMACGSGKTLVALWLAERAQVERVIVFVPSLALIRQCLHEWLRETNWAAPEFICICSDQTVVSGIDGVTVLQSEADFPVSTDASTLSSFLNGNSVAPKIVFATYQSADVVAVATKNTNGFDLGIFDEAHKTASRKGTHFALALHDANVPIRKRVFLTATPRHYDIGHKTAEGEALEVFSMEDRNLYGLRAYTLSFSEAARRKIICDYKVIISVVTSEMVGDELLKYGEVLFNGDLVQARTVAHQIALKRACEEHQVKKLFTFHARVEHARKFVEESNQSISNFLPEYSAMHVSGDMPTAHREKIMLSFSRAPRALISNARCLTEGVDVPAVDMVAFMSPRRSKVDIVQATGRAMRKASGKTTGYVMVPLYLEIARNESVEEALKRTDFYEIWNVLQAMKEQDSALEDIIAELRMKQGREGSIDSYRLFENIEVLGPTISLEDLNNAIAIRILESIGTTWDQRFGELQAYKVRFGNCEVPQRWTENLKLATWIGEQRKFKNRGVLDPTRIMKLDSLGFQWDPLEEAWNEKFEELRQFKVAHGHCNVPNRWKQNPGLGTWVGNQRRRKLKGELEADRVMRLEVLGFEWSRDEHFDQIWNLRFKELCEYKEKYSNCDVPSRWNENPKLATWTREQRTLKRKGSLPNERQVRLESIGFKWNLVDAEWERMFERLVQFQKENGHCNVHGGIGNNKDLGQWITRQRKAYKSGKLENERCTRLESLGIQWDPVAEVWELRFSELLDYKKRFGDCNVPGGWKENPKLASWVGIQRRRISEGHISAEQLRRINALDFESDPLSATWERNFQELSNFKDQNGNCDIPRLKGAQKSLGGWVSEQRKANAAEKLDLERILRLNELGFEWDPLGAEWNRKVIALREFKAKNGHCDLTRDTPGYKELASWLHDQRKRKRSGKLAADKIEELSNIGVKWAIHEPAWERAFTELAEFLGKNGIISLPKNSKLSGWLQNQRTRKKKGDLENDRIEKLERLGIDWEVRDAFWEDRYSDLCAFKTRFGHCNVPRESSENKQLASWLGTQRTRYREGKLDGDRIAKLEAIGFQWNQLTASWESCFNKLISYKGRFGNCNVPQGWNEDKELGSWVSEQRTAKRRGVISPDRLARLEALGFQWNRLVNAWEINFADLLSYKTAFGDCNVPADWKDNSKLAKWVGRQREFKRKGSLDSEKIARLDSINFEWDPISAFWEKQFQALESFKKTFGHCKVPEGYQENPQLASWVSNQRSRIRASKLDPSRIERLRRLGLELR